MNRSGVEWNGLTGPKKSELIPVKGGLLTHTSTVLVTITAAALIGFSKLRKIVTIVCKNREKSTTTFNDAGT